MKPPTVMVRFPHRQSKRSNSESTHRRSAGCNHSGRGCFGLHASIAIALSIPERALPGLTTLRITSRPRCGHCWSHTGYGCHGKTQQKGRLRLDSRKALLKGGRSGPAIVSGNPQAKPAGPSDLTNPRSSEDASQRAAPALQSRDVDAVGE